MQNLCVKETLHFTQKIQQVPFKEILCYIKKKERKKEKIQQVSVKTVRTYFSAPVPTNLSTEESYAELSSLDKSYDNPTFSEASQSQDDVNRTYRHVKRLIQLQSDLAKEPELLQQKYENLKDLGDDVSDCIADLKQASENIAKKS